MGNYVSEVAQLLDEIESEFGVISDEVKKAKKLLAGLEPIPPFLETRAWIKPVIDEMPDYFLGDVNSEYGRHGYFTMSMEKVSLLICGDRYNWVISDQESIDKVFAEIRDVLRLSYGLIEKGEYKHVRDH